jgi:hypothetical protein
MENAKEQASAQAARRRIYAVDRNLIVLDTIAVEPNWRSVGGLVAELVAGLARKAPARGDA